MLNDEHFPKIEIKLLTFNYLHLKYNPRLILKLGRRKNYFSFNI